MSPLVFTLIVLVIAVLWMIFLVFPLYVHNRISEHALYVNALMSAILVGGGAFASLIAWWLHPLRDTPIGGYDGFMALTVAIIAAVGALRTRKLIMKKFGYDPVPR